MELLRQHTLARDTLAFLYRRKRLQLRKDLSIFHCRSDVSLLWALVLQEFMNPKDNCHSWQTLPVCCSELMTGTRRSALLHLLPWQETTPHLAQYPLFPKPSHCRHTELFSPWQHLGPSCTCNCIIPCASIRIRECASPCPQSAFSFLRGKFLLFSPPHSRVP